MRLLGKMGEAPLDRDYVFAVCDGLGGAKAGEFASRIAVEKITKIFPSYLVQKRLPDEEESAATHLLLVKLFAEIHRTLLFLSASYDECHGMGTTLTLCWIRPHRCYFAHIGDSRLYHLQSKANSEPTMPTAERGESSKSLMKQLSEDDTHVGWLFRQGKISEYEAKHHLGRNLLQKALGADHQFIAPQIGSFMPALGDRLLLCTDGVTDGLFDHQLWNIITHPTKESPACHLVREAVLQSGRDNATATVLEFEH
jgi:protein phosphatase